MPNFFLIIAILSQITNFKSQIMSEIQSSKKKSGKILLVILLIISVLSNLYLMYDRHIQNRKSQAIIAELEITHQEKDSISTELADLFTEYEYLKQNNDSLTNELSSEQEKIQLMLSEIKNLKSSDRRKLRNYKKELKTLRKIMRGYIVQLDSLNTMNKTLTAENRKIKTDFRRAKNENNRLEDKIDTLSNTVKKASAIKAISMRAIGLNPRDKPVKKADKIDKVEVCCDLTENVITNTGEKTIYLRIARPDGVVLTKSPNNQFEYQGDMIIYSARRIIKYTGESMKLCIYWLNDEALPIGIYQIDLFLDGNQIGTTTLGLK